MKRLRQSVRWLGCAWFTLAFVWVAAEQSQTFGDFEVHYSVVNSTFLQPDIATRYNITRAPNRAFIMLSVLDKEGKSSKAEIEGVYINLLSQEMPLSFTPITEGESHYYVASFRHTDQELLKFKIALAFIGGQEHSLEFEQKVYVR